MLVPPRDIVLEVNITIKLVLLLLVIEVTNISEIMEGSEWYWCFPNCAGVTEGTPFPGLWDSTPKMLSLLGRV